jgi:outer membrane protein assembly factor BamB
MVFGDGFTVLDHDGYPFLTALEGTTVHAATVDPGGQILALVTHVPEGGEPEVVRIYAYTERFEPIWWADIDPPGGGGGDITVREDFIAVSYGATTEARAADGAPLWRVDNAGGPLLVGPGDTTYLQGVNEAAVTRAGEVLWSTARGARFVLTDRGLGAIWKGVDRFGSESTVVGFIDPATGDVLESTAYPPLTDFAAPAIIDGRLVAAGHVVNTNQSFNPGGDLVVSQDAERAFFTSSAAGLADGWPTAGGPGSTRSGPVAAKIPTENELMGFWVARDGTRVRVLEFAAQ